jgi:hypothetical protein
MASGWLDAVTDATIWGRVTGEDVDGPVPVRIEVDGRLWGYARAGHLDPEGGPWRFAVAHHLTDGQAVSVSAVLPGQEPVLLEGSPRRVPASAPPRGRLEAVTATEVVGWAVDDDYDGPVTVALYVDGIFWTRVTADQPRPDLETEGAATHGFSVPHALRPGQQVEAWALGVRSDGSRDRQAVDLAGSPATTPDGYLAPGVVHQAITDPAGPFAIHLVTVTLAAPSTVDLALALDVLPGLETTSSMARRRGASVAVHGDYADPDHAGRPINAFAKDGRLLQTPFLPGNNHAVDDREAAVFMGRPNVQVVAEVPGPASSCRWPRSTGGRRPATRWPCSPPRGSPWSGRRPTPPRPGCGPPARRRCGPTAGPRPPTRSRRWASSAGPCRPARWCCRPRRTGPRRPTWPRSSRARRSPWPGASPPGRGSWTPAAATRPWSATAGSWPATSTAPPRSTAATPGPGSGPPPTGGCCWSPWTAAGPATASA